MRKVDLLKVLELFYYPQNYQMYGLERGILLPLGNGNMPDHVWHPIGDQRKKVDLVKGLGLFFYLQKCLSYGPESVKQSPKTGILFPHETENVLF